ncbi:MAG: tripartite tricarboxylate transporter permease [bacterium]
MDWLGPAISSIFDFSNLLYLFLAVSGGIMVGALPGLTGTMAIALLVPFTYGLSPETALIVLGGVYVGAMYGGSISAILINTPGAPAAIATTFDGYPMAVQGKAEEALAASVTGSFIGGVIGTICLLFFSPILAAISLKFGPPEYFWLGVLGLTIIASLSAKSLAKGLLGGLFGVLLSTVGLSPSTGISRMTFDTSDLLGGVEIIVALIGLFCIPQVLKMAESGGQQETVSLFKPVRGRSIATALFVATRWGNLIRSSIIGVIVGIIPGAGGNVAGLLSYQEVVRAAKDKSTFGHGNIEGVIASETANNAEVEGSLIPLLTLGIPGAPQAAVLYGALLLQGLRPGAELFTGRGAEITYTFILSLFLANFMMFAIGLSSSRLYARALNLPRFLLMPMVLALSFVGSFAGRNSAFDVGVMLVLGLLAYGGIKVGLSPAPIALGVILGPITEKGLVESLMLSRATGSLVEMFLTRPLSLVLIVLTLTSAGWPLYLKYRDRLRPGHAGKAPEDTQPADDFRSVAAKKKEEAAFGLFTSNTILGLAGLLIAAIVWWQMQEIDDLQTFVLPLATAGLMAVVSIGLLIKAWTVRSEAASRISTGFTGNRVATLSAIGLALAYVLLMEWIGFFVTTYLILVCLGFVLAPVGSRSRLLPKILVTMSIICILFYGVFVKLFNVPFSGGILF